MRHVDRDGPEMSAGSHFIGAKVGVKVGERLVEEKDVGLYNDKIAHCAHIARSALYRFAQGDSRQLSNASTGSPSSLTRSPASRRPGDDDPNRGHQNGHRWACSDGSLTKPV